MSGVVSRNMRRAPLTLRAIFFTFLRAAILLVFQELPILSIAVYTPYMEIITALADFILHIDEHLTQITATYGLMTYGIVFTIIFIETGLVFFPFLPGDSLLFTAGAIAALGTLNIWIMIGLLVVAAMLGDTVNYWIGHFFGEKIVDSPKVPFFNRSHLEKTKAFYDKHGGKTIILARFIPIIRTFAPFVAGVGKMEYAEFIKYNVAGAMLWVFGLTFAGYFFGNIGFVRQHFEIVVIIIIILSVISPIFEWVRHHVTKHEV